MTWNQRPGPSGSGPRDGWMRQFLRRKAEQQVGMLTALTERLERDLAKLPADAVPGKEWVRVARLRLDAYRMLATLELETAKVRLVAERSHVRAPMSDEEFQREIEALGREAMRALSDDELRTEIERRRALPSE
jgi:predicted nucleic acid-binding protein